MSNDMIPDTDEDDIALGDEMLISFDNGHLNENNMNHHVASSGPLNEALKQKFKL